MLVADRVVYLQLQKTASTRITDLVQATVGGEERSKHDRLRRADLKDPDFAAKYVFGSIRDPWAYYVSLWAFGCARAGGLYERTTGRAREDQPAGLQGQFGHKSVPLDERGWRDRRRADRWRASYRDADDPEAFREWIRLLNHPRYRGDLGEGYGKSAIAGWAGLVTYRFCILYLLGCVPGEPHEELASRAALEAACDDRLLCRGMVRVEHLADDLEAVLTEAGYDLDEDQRATLHASSDNRGENRSRHRPTDWYYDDATHDLVRRRDAFVIERYGYG